MILVSRKTPPCPACNEAKVILARKGVEYTEVDINEAGVKEAVMSFGIRAIPAVFGESIEYDEYLGSLDFVKTIL